MRVQCGSTTDVPRDRVLYATPHCALQRVPRSTALMPPEPCMPRGSARMRSVVGVADDLLDALLDLRRNLLGHVGGFHVLTDLFDPRRARDHRADMRILQNPRDRQLTDRAAQLVGHFTELADYVVLAGVGDLLAQPVVAL